MNNNDSDCLERFILSCCESLQNHINQCLNNSDDMSHYDEMMSLFKTLRPELSGWVLQTTLEEWKQESGEFFLDLD